MKSKILLSALVAGILSGAIYMDMQRKERRRDGTYIYSATEYAKEGATKGKVISYSHEEIYLNDTLLRLFDRDTNNVVDGVYYEDNFPACDGMLGVDSVFYKESQKLNRTGPDYGFINFELNLGTIDLATKIYNARNTSNNEKIQWRADVRNLVQMVNDDYKSLWQK